MSEDINKVDLELITVIVNFGAGSKALKACKKGGVRGGTILVGRGTLKNKFLEMLQLNDVRKEILITVCQKEDRDAIFEQLSKTLHLEKPNHGIAFSIDVSGLYGTNVAMKRENSSVEKIGGKSMYTQIMVIVDRGKAEDVMEAANSAGGRGGTIINARGSGIHETSILFSMEIEPEKEIVLILAKKDTVDNIISTVSDKMNITQPGNGIIFTSPVSRTCGMAE